MAGSVSMSIAELDEGLRELWEIVRAKFKFFKEEIEKLKESRDLLKEELRVVKEERKGMDREEQVVDKDRMSQMERKWEMKEREERKENVIIKGMDTRGEIKEKVNELLDTMKEGIRTDEVRILKHGYDGMVWMKLKSSEERRMILENKNKLRGRREWVEKDLTWEERRVQWKLRSMAAKMRVNDKRVRVDHGKIWVEEKWWFWVENAGELRDGKGNKWTEQRYEREQGGSPPERGGSVG